MSLGTTLDELSRTSALMAGEIEFHPLVSILVEQSIEISRSDLSAFYLYAEQQEGISDLKLLYKRGRVTPPSRIEKSSEIVEFIYECNEAVVLMERKESPFLGLLLHQSMQSGIALPLSGKTGKIGVLILNSTDPGFYHRERFYFLESLSKLASGMLQNSKTYRSLKEYAHRIEELRIYQENIFSSMTNLLVTTDAKGEIHYFNNAARERLNLDDSCIGKSMEEIFQKRIAKKLITSVKTVKDTERELLGIKGIYQLPEKEIDFSMNVSPLRGKRGKYQGLTILLTDETREQELKEQVETVTEERRVIKDMFSRYLSQDIVKNLMDAPELLRPGGDKKIATVFFADIRGYTHFSEGKEPEYIIEVLNDYFKEAVEIVIKYRGYIDKFIGDCIMAAWGVPLESEKYDAGKAVACALEIQQLVRSKDRTFFKGEASNLTIGIGMHTGPLVAGNLGSSRRMDYSIIGDTVNVAARLEGVAGPGEIIITDSTRSYLGSGFRLEKKKPVQVKGKTEPIPIYRVVGKE
ncbi:MAG: PAS domain-containing protein [Spirochaetales bacterium]|nr:PAS domain-containing protein [Spirochaetales bacterium]